MKPPIPPLTPLARLTFSIHHLRVKPTTPLFPQCAIRALHSRRSAHAAALESPPATDTRHHPPHNLQPPNPPPVSRNVRPPSPLSSLPLSQVIRTYLITAISSSPLVLDTLVAILTRMLNSKNPITSIEKNPLLRWSLKKAFYAQFCAGETRAEVSKTTQRMKAQGYDGIMYEFALEVLKPPAGVATPSAESPTTMREIEKWRAGMLETIAMADEGEFVGFKWSGLGQHALGLLKGDHPPTPHMLAAIHQVCDAAAAKSVGMLPGAEEDVTNTGIESWNMMLQSQYNAKLRPDSSGNGESGGGGGGGGGRKRAADGKAIMYNTYQCYFRSTPAKIARHLAAAHANNHVLGVKLVRGAYLGLEPPSAVVDSIAETHASYDDIAACLMRRQWGGRLQPPSEKETAFPAVNVVLATHNADSLRKALALRKGQVERGEDLVPLAMIQLMGMADELGCELVAAAKADGDAGRAGEGTGPRLMKCATWGTLEECLEFLLRRAAENKDAAGRTGDSRRAMGAELWRRARGVVGLR